MVFHLIGDFSLQLHQQLSHHERKEIRLLPLSIALGGFSLLLCLLSAGIREIFTHSKRYTAGHQRLMLLKKHHPEKTAKRHAKKNMSKMEGE